MKRIACIVAYDGSAYEGWQSQLRMTSVQEQIEAVLEKIEGHRIPITASGRTDAGVNASGQVFMFDTERDMSAYKWKGALNGLLPRDIHIVQAEEKDGRFHARYNVKRKTYLYRIHTGEYDVFTRNIAYQCPQLLDIDAMREAAKELTGTHDFTSFNKNTDTHDRCHYDRSRRSHDHNGIYRQGLFALSGAHDECGTDRSGKGKPDAGRYPKHTGSAFQDRLCQKCCSAGTDIMQSGILCDVRTE